jgi:IS30 family transposase
VSDFLSQFLTPTAFDKMPTVRRDRQHHQVSDFDRGRIVALREAGLSYRAIAFRVDRSAATVVRICYIWEEERRGIRRRSIGLPRRTTARKNRRL